MVLDAEGYGYNKINGLARHRDMGNKEPNKAEKHWRNGWERRSKSYVPETPRYEMILFHKARVYLGQYRDANARKFVSRVGTTLWPAHTPTAIVCWLVGWLTSQQHASVSQGRICSDNFTCCHTEIEVADQTFHLTQSQYTDTGPTSPSADPVTPSAWQGSHWSANFEVTGMTRPRKNPGASGIRTRDLPLSRRTP